jgi:hypothetical protein
MARPSSGIRTGPVPKAIGAVRAVVDWLARSPQRSFIVIFLLSFTIRGYYLMALVARDYVLPRSRWEMEAVATSLAQSRQLADPYVLTSFPPDLPRMCHRFSPASAL